MSQKIEANDDTITESKSGIFTFFLLFERTEKKLTSYFDENVNNSKINPPYKSDTPIVSF
jgi:hypothetical protein